MVLQLCEQVVPLPLTFAMWLYPIICSKPPPSAPPSNSPSGGSFTGKVKGHIYVRHGDEMKGWQEGGGGDTVVLNDCDTGPLGTEHLCMGHPCGGGVTWRQSKKQLLYAPIAAGGGAQQGADDDGVGKGSEGRR